MRGLLRPCAIFPALLLAFVAAAAGAADDPRRGFVSPATGAMPVMGWPAPAELPTAPPDTTWRRNAVDPGEPPEPPMVAVVLDDLGLDHAATRRAIAFPGAVTLAFLPYAPEVDDLTDEARAAGHELLVHLPMEARDSVEPPGPHALEVAADRATLLANIGWNLDRFDDFVGVNNHMGSRFTADRPGMRVLMRRLKARELLFLDSVTTADSVSEAVGKSVGVPVIRRDVFLGNESEKVVRQRLDRAVAQAERIGHAVAVGHPHEVTMDVLGQWLPDPPENITLVPLSAIPRYAPPLAEGGGGAESRQASTKTSETGGAS